MAKRFMVLAHVTRTRWAHQVTAIVFCISFDRKVTPNTVTSWTRDRELRKEEDNTCISALAIDQAHEQNNASVKDDGGAVGLTENPAALRRWMVSGPEMARVIAEFQATSET